LIWVAATACLGASGCGEEEPKKSGGGSLGGFDIISDTSGGADGTSADGEDPSDGEDSEDGADGAEQVTVQVLSPQRAQSLESDQIVTVSRFTARCRARSGGDALIDEAKLEMEVEAADGTLLREGGRTTATADEYAADFDVSGFENGALKVRCVAQQKGGDGVWSDEVETYLDLGPRITVQSPTVGGAYGQLVTLDVTVEAAPLTDADAQAALGGVTFLIAGQVLPESMIAPAGGGRFQGTVRFDDALFDPALSGENTLTIRAVNNRPPTPVVAEATVKFVADSQGPKIVITKPEIGALVGGVFKVQAEITDVGAINGDTVVATIAQTVQARMRLVSGNIYEGEFDSRTLSRDWVFPLLEVRAQDAAGNQASLGFQVTLDARPPVAHLDPHDVREAKVAQGQLQCSERFDPVGEDALQDGESIPQLSKLRARIEDRGNGGISNSGGIVIPIGGVDDAKVRLFVLNDATGALIVDTDGDGFCDAINPLIVPTSVPDASNEAAVLNMTPLDPQGASFFNLGIDTSTFGTDPLIPDGACVPGTTATAPAAVCPVVSGMSRVVAAMDGRLPLIYTLPPVDNGRCLGNAFDALASNLGEGWACLAIEIHDTLGNVGVSPPMRLCVDTNGDGSDGCLPWSAFGRVINPLNDRPNCTGTFNPVNNTVSTAQPCTFRAEEDLLNPINAGMNLIRTDLN
jgi:hypothetical protein